MTEPKPAPRIFSTLITLLLFVAMVAMGTMLFVKLRNRSAPGEVDGTASPIVGQHLSTIELQPLTGATAAVGLSDLRGKVTLMNFWGTWCPPCIHELPHLVALEEGFQREPDFQFWAVSCGQALGDPESLRQDTREFLARGNYDFPTYSDQNSITRRAIGELADVGGIPLTLIFDREGVVRGFWMGYYPENLPKMKQLLTALLREPKPAANSSDPHDY